MMVFLRRKDGSFAERARVRFTQERSIERGKARPYLVDWNRDGHTDLVIGYPGSSWRSWTLEVALGPLRGKKDILPTKPVKLPSVPGDPSHFAFVDWDGDGRMDLLVGVEWDWPRRYNPSGSYPWQPKWCSVYWLRNTSDTGPPKFAEPSHLLDIPRPWELRALTAVNWGGDSRPSLVVSVSSGCKLGEGGGWWPVASELWLYRRKADREAAPDRGGW